MYTYPASALSPLFIHTSLPPLSLLFYTRRVHARARLLRILAEIVEYTAPDEIAVCNLASIALNMFVNVEARTYNFEKRELAAQ